MIWLFYCTEMWIHLKTHGHYTKNNHTFKASNAPYLLLWLFFPPRYCPCSRTAIIVMNVPHRIVEYVHIHSIIIVFSTRFINIHSDAKKKKNEKRKKKRTHEKYLKYFEALVLWLKFPFFPPQNCLQNLTVLVFRFRHIQYQTHKNI